MVNKVILIGNLGRDPELRYTQSGTAVCNFTMATSRRWNDREGERQEETEWHRIVAWARLAEICGQYLAKGKQVYIEGRLQTRQWEDRDGNTRYTTEIVAENMQMLGRPGDFEGYDPGSPGQAIGSGTGGGSGSGSGSGGGDQSGGGGAGSPVTDDDIPF